jgi:hypothetical protein
MKTLFPALERLALYATLGLTPFWLSGCAMGPAGVNVPRLQQIILNPAVTHLLPADFAAPKTADVG